MPRALQAEIFTSSSPGRLSQYAKRREHGGSTRPGRRKVARPIDVKRPMHLVFRSEKATGKWSLLRLKTVPVIQKILEKAARANGVRIHEQGNSGNHIHLLVSAKTRRGFQNFCRTVGALIARAVTGAKKGNSVGKFWDTLMYSRVVGWGREFERVKRYVLMNHYEGQGISGFRIRPKKAERPHVASARTAISRR